MNFHVFEADEVKALLDMPTQLSEFMKEIRMNEADLKTKLDAIHTTLVADQTAIAAKFTAMQASIDTLTAAVANAGSTTPEVDAALADVQSSADALAALVPAPTA